MATIALKPGYAGPNRDAVENFGGNILVYLHWQEHLSFCAALAFPLPPDMPFAAIIGELIPEYYGSHPDFANVDWSQVRWEVDGQTFTPDPDTAIGQQGVGHKSLVRFWTPGLNGYQGSNS
jgi:phenol hydroxylase P4 protein